MYFVYLLIEKNKNFKIVMEETKHIKKKIQTSEKSDLIFPVGRIGKMLRKGSYSTRVSLKAAIALSAVVEYICAEVLDVSAEQAIKQS